MAIWALKLWMVCDDFGDRIHFSTHECEWLGEGQGR